MSCWLWNKYHSCIHPTPCIFDFYTSPTKTPVVSKAAMAEPTETIPVAWTAPLDFFGVEIPNQINQFNSRLVCNVRFTPLKLKPTYILFLVAIKANIHIVHLKFNHPLLQGTRFFGSHGCTVWIYFISVGNFCDELHVCFQTYFGRLCIFHISIITIANEIALAATRFRCYISNSDG